MLWKLFLAPIAQMLSGIRLKLDINHGTYLSCEKEGEIIFPTDGAFNVQLHYFAPFLTFVNQRSWTRKKVNFRTNILACTVNQGGWTDIADFGFFSSLSKNSITEKGWMYKHPTSSAKVMNKKACLPKPCPLQKDDKTTMTAALWPYQKYTQGPKQKL